MTTNPNIYFTDGCGRCSSFGTPECKVHRWAKELALLRDIALESGLEETCKYGSPFYTLGSASVIWIGVLKEYCLVGFAKGALLADPHNVLYQQTENVQGARLVRFFNVADVQRLEPTLRELIFEAIEVEKAGLKIQYKSTAEYEMPEELEQALAEMPDFRAAFEALTPGRQRGYLLHFGQPKQSKTRMERIEKCMPLIFEGKGLQDDYRQKKKEV
jgi:uncharacterized protein YdeI (YjbR/CyaY-like superfamily)